MGREEIRKRNDVLLLRRGKPLFNLLWGWQIDIVSEIEMKPIGAIFLVADPQFIIVVWPTASNAVSGYPGRASPPPCPLIYGEGI